MFTLSCHLLRSFDKLSHGKTASDSKILSAKEDSLMPIDCRILRNTALEPCRIGYLQSEIDMSIYVWFSGEISVKL